MKNSPAQSWGVMLPLGQFDFVDLIIGHAEPDFGADLNLYIFLIFIL
jgi:hypothetical protein